MSTPLTHSITEDDIANYLANTPDFFDRHAELLASVQLCSPHSSRAVSLQERQATLLREKIKLLELRIVEMMRHGSENVALSDKLLRWAISLFLATEPRDLPGQIARQIAELFSVPQIGIKVWGVAVQFANAEFATGVSEDAKLFASSLMEPFCGVNTGFEVVSWLPDPLSATSLAMLPLRIDSASGRSPAFGLIVLASPDAHRFSSSLGTEFLAQIGELASAALSRLR